MSVVGDIVADHQQRRMRVLYMGIGACAMTILTTLAVYWAGLLDGRVAANYVGAVLAACAVFYVIFRGGLNRRFRDPNLTAAQLLLAGVTLAYAAFHAVEARPAFLLMYFIAFMFGVFVLHVRGLIVLAAYFIACYAAVILLSAWLQPAITNMPREILRLSVFSVALIWFVIIGAHIAALRTDLREANRRLRLALESAESLAGVDALTGAANRRRMQDMLEIEAKRAQRGTPFSVLMLDLDHFKRVNDVHGHLGGDRVLREFAVRVGRFLRGTDFLARYGGEEFLVALSQTTGADAAAVAERIRQEIAAYGFPGLPDDFRITVSIGVAEHVAGEPVDQTLARSDAALYEAKHAGRNRVVCAGPKAQAA